MWTSSDVALWVLSAAIGVLGILVLFTVGAPGVVLIFVPLLIVWIRSGTHHSLKAGGALAGFGAAFLAILAAANARCAEFSAQDRQSCTAPDVTVFSVTAAVLLVLGLALTLRAWRLRAA
ncbi:MAG: hypothetical protein M3P38_04485 [Chloroflexota bacterium]|nr:hypothetical protein [Chloroflexota bacterium]